MQHIGVHRIGAGHRGNRCARNSAGSDKFGLEFAGVGPVRTSGRIPGSLRIFEHRVHDWLRAHDLARSRSTIQDGFAGRIRSKAAGLACRTLGVKRPWSLTTTCWPMARFTPESPGVSCHQCSSNFLSVHSATCISKSWTIAEITTSVSQTTSSNLRSNLFILAIPSVGCRRYAT